MNPRVLISFSLLLLVGGCSVGPDYRPPQPTTPASFVEAPASTQPAVSDATLASWWEVFGDPGLSALVDRAIRSNLDLRTAAARVIEARSVYLGSRSGLFPSFDAVGGYRHDRSSDNADGNSGNAMISRDPDRHDWSVGFDASWEIDLFGGVRRSIEAADADFSAAVEDHRDVLVTLLADVARNYILLRGAQRQLEIVQKNLETQLQTLELTRSRFRAGLTSDLDVARAEAQAMTTRAQIPPLEDQIRQSIRRLGVLCGESPEALADELSPVAEIPRSTLDISAGVPSEMLRRRPDIRRAERRLAAETARIGVAVSDLFPKFSITGDFGLVSRDLKNLLERDSIGWSIGPTLRWQILNFGRVQSGIRAQEARAEQALRQYEQTVLLSLEETENALGSYRREQARRESLASAVESSRRAVELADQLYRQGLTAFQDVLDAQRRLLEVESQFVTSDQTVSTNLVAVYKALGGGWETKLSQVDRGPLILIP
ncbi:MAG: efflux transporter outer membrane subunit [Phycisphaerae bacterium]|nr:efflux transporter outer membrane subunit [Phycisphaerae bacterium]MDW8261097.1 efflux transporter outer membrane subunit [Phycisphaerales bacterium]